MKVLVVVSVDAEASAIAAQLGDADLVVAGVGPVEAAAATAYALARTGYDLVLCAGIAGGFAPRRPGEVAVASSIVFADVGAETVDGFAPLATLGFGSASYPVGPKLAIELADRTGGHLGTVLTVATVTGTAETAAAHLARFPDAVAEGMEGAGVAAAARRFGTPFGEVRAISNVVGPRDRNSWQIDSALAALGPAIAAVTHG